MASADVSSSRTKTSSVEATRARPSSPRRFFARLYGNLNDSDKVEREKTFPLNEKLVEDTEDQTTTALCDVRHDRCTTEENEELAKTMNRDGAIDIRQRSESFDEAIRRKLVHNRWQRESVGFGIDRKRTSRETVKREEINYFDRNRDDEPEEAQSGICASALVSRRLFMCRGFSAPIAIHPAAAAAAAAAAATTDVAAASSGSVLSASSLHHLTHVGHQLTPPAPFSHLHGNLQVEAHLHGLSSFLARRRKKESRPRRQRTTYSGEQTARLEFEYHRGEYISQKRRSELAQSLHLTETQIKIWFQNRRAKYKRINKAMLDQHYRNIVVSNGLVNLPICNGASAYLGDFSFRRDNGDARGTADNFVAMMTRDKEQCGSDGRASDVRNSTRRCTSSGSEELPHRVVSPL